MRVKDEDKEDDRGIRARWKAHRELQKLEHLRRVQLGQRGFLRPEIVQLFEQQPMNGVDIMNKLQEMSHGWYRPSPGSVYPILEQLEREGLIAKNKEGKFQLTAAFGGGQAGSGDISDAITTMESNASYLEDLQKTGPAGLAGYRERLDKLSKRLASLSTSQQPHAGP